MGRYPEGIKFTSHCYIVPDRNYMIQIQAVHVRYKIKILFIESPPALTKPSPKSGIEGHSTLKKTAHIPHSKPMLIR